MIITICVKQYMYVEKSEYRNDPKFLDKLSRPRSDCSTSLIRSGCSSSLIRIFTVCYSICIILRYHTTVELLSLNFRVFTLKLVGVHKFRNFTCLEFGYLQMLTRSPTLEPRCEKTGLRGFRPGPTLTRLYSYRRWLETRNSGFRKKRDCTIHVAKTKALISFAVTAKLICVFVFAYAKKRFSHDAAHYIITLLHFYSF